MGSWIDKGSIYTHNGTLLSLKGDFTICDNMDEPWRPVWSEIRPVVERQIIHSLLMRYLI